MLGNLVVSLMKVSQYMIVTVLSGTDLTQPRQ